MCLSHHCVTLHVSRLELSERLCQVRATISSCRRRSWGSEMCKLPTGRGLSWLRTARAGDRPLWWGTCARRETIQTCRAGGLLLLPLPPLPRASSPAALPLLCLLPPERCREREPRHRAPIVPPGAQAPIVWGSCSGPDTGLAVTTVRPQWLFVPTSPSSSAAQPSPPQTPATYTQDGRETGDKGSELW